MQGTLTNEGIATGYIKNSLYLQSFRTVSASCAHPWSFLACSTWQKHSVASMKAFAPVSLQKALLPWWEAPWCFVLQESSELPGEIPVESSRQTKPEPPGAGSCLHSALTFKAQGRSELPAELGKLSWAFLVLHVLQVVFHPFKNFYRTHGNEMTARCIFFSFP